MMNRVMIFSVFLMVSFQAKGQSQDSLLTVDQTLEFIQRVYMDMVPQEAVEMSKRANPAARERLYQILNDPGKMDIWPQVVGAFAYLGQREDVPRLESFLQKRQGTLKGLEYSSVIMLFNAYGGMGGRGIKESNAKLKQMMKPDYWKNTKFKTQDRQPSGNAVFENQMRLLALQGYTYTQSNDFEQVAEELVNSTKDPKEKKFLRQKANEAVQRNTEYKTYRSVPKKDH